MSRPDFPIPGTVRTPNGLMRADVRTVAERTCGCGQPMAVALYTATFRVKNGRKDRRTRRIPLCAEHDAASRAQAQRRRAAIARAWCDLRL